MVLPFEEQRPGKLGAAVPLQPAVFWHEGWCHVMCFAEEDYGGGFSDAHLVMAPVGASSWLLFQGGQCDGGSWGGREGMDGELGGEESSSCWLDATGMVGSWQHLMAFHSAYERANGAGEQLWLMGSPIWGT